MAFEDSEQQEISVVNTFIHFSERAADAAKRFFNRSRTAPVDTISSFEDDPREEELLRKSTVHKSCPSDSLASVAQCTQSLDSDVVDCSEPSDTLPARSSMDRIDESECEDHPRGRPKFVSQSSLRRIVTPDRWESSPVAKGIEATPQSDSATNVDSSKMRRTSRPVLQTQTSLQRIVTPERWEQPTAVRPQRSMSPRSMCAAQDNSNQPLTVPSLKPPTFLQLPIHLQAMPLLLMPSQLSLMTQRQDLPHLLGRTASPSPEKPRSTELQTLQPGSLLFELLPNGKECVRWSVDGRKLMTNAEKILSSEFSLSFPDQPSQVFRIMIHATETGGRHGAGFLKASGSGQLYLKCQSSSPSQLPKLSFRVSVHGQVAHKSRSEVFCHNFSDHNCCSLQKGDEDWNLKGLLTKDSKWFEIRLEVLQYISD